MVDPNEAIASCSRTEQTQGLLAQLVEHRTFNPLVAGSNPAQPIPPSTNKMESKMNQVPVWNIDNNNTTTYTANTSFDKFMHSHGAEAGWHARSVVTVNVDIQGVKSVTYKVDIKLECWSRRSYSGEALTYSFTPVHGLRLERTSKRAWINNTGIPSYVLEYCLQVANHASTL